jgi:hypothetical protein
MELAVPLRKIKLLLESWENGFFPTLKFLFQAEAKPKAFSWLIPYRKHF